MVTDVENEIKGGPFETKFELLLTKPLNDEGESDEHEEEEKERRERKTPGDRGGAPILAVPNIVEVTKDRWDSMMPPFSRFDSMRVRQDGNGGFDFYVNLDNSFLLTELSRSGNTEKELVRYWFKYGLVLCGLGMLQQFTTTESPNGAGNTETEDAGNSSMREPLELVNDAMAGLARVIIPVVRSLYRGPR